MSNFQLLIEAIRKRGRFFFMLLSLGLIVLILWLSLIRPHHQHVRAYYQIESLILKLSVKRPQDVSPDCWAFCLMRTWNLHTNCGPPYQFRDKNQIQRFAVELDRRVDDHVDISTIDWVWDQYVLNTSGGKSYSDHYRPTLPERLREVDENGLGGQDSLDWWIEQYELEQAAK